MSEKRLIFVTLTVILSGYLSAQTNKLWADSVYNQLYQSSVQDFEIAESQLDSVLVIYKQLKDHCGTIRALSLKSKVYLGKSNFEEAMSSIIEAEKLYNKAKCKPLDLIEIYGAYARLYNRLDNFAKADSFVSKALKIYKPEYQDTTTLVRLYILRGVIAQDFDEALKYYNSALTLVHLANLEYLDHSIHNNLGYLYANAGDFNKALKEFNLALVKAKKLKLDKQLSWLYNNLAGLSDDNKQALVFVDSALHYAYKTNILADIQLFTENKGYALSKLGRYKEAYKYLWRAYNFKDSLVGENKIIAVLELEEKYEAEKKANEIQKLKNKNLNSEVEKLQFKRNQTNLIVGSSILLLLAGAFAYSFINTKKNKNKLAQKNIELEHERQVSDELLLNILPGEVAEELKQKGKADAKLYDNVTVLFTDFVSFTAISENMNPNDLVAEIHRLFTAFDGIMDKYGLEKIKTIGDAYLAVCGLPDSHNDHATRVLNAATDILAITQEQSSKFQVRIGVNSGPVVAGIVGVKKYAYDIWGDTVNTASRMEESSISGKINISGSTFELVKNEFDCKYRGKIEAKNKGFVDMYFVKGKHDFNK